MQPTHYIPTLLYKSKTCFWWKTEETQDSRGTRSMPLQGKYNNNWQDINAQTTGQLMQHMQAGPGLVSLLASEVQQVRSILNNWVGEQ